MAKILPSGVAKLAKRVLEDYDQAAAEELCRRMEDASITEIVKEFFAGKLTGPVFDCLADSHDRVRRAREADTEAGITA